ncbi:MAG: GNAT family N-acetyltransferase [Bacteroidota bacterium]
MIIRQATKSDVPLIVEMLANDTLGKQREQYRDPLPEAYYQAFERINTDPNHELLVVEKGGEIVATMQLTFLQYLTYRGGIRAQIEAVRVRDDQRGQLVGEQLVRWAINRSREVGAHMIQLTSDKQRDRAIRFYEKIGFSATHEGLKMKLI